MLNVLAVSEETSGSPSQNKVSGNPLIGIAAGFGAMIGGIALWIAVAQKYQITWMSIVVAFGIASAVKYAGRVTLWWPGVVSALFALFAAIAGNLATAVFIVSKRGKTPGEIISGMDIGTAITFLKALSGPMGVLMYLITLYVGFWFAFKHEPKKPVGLPD